ncbi:universal stress protein [Patulibacter sp.]|uniref:universal stress protein n=1 Tax=Patulibacter sp. TaxID=1912859 RepID=UPI002720F7AE|nr:universal stress protein [Patulibacter sp.]MDO9410877.1 universal stress protein [Patulibacter sp.]
MFHRILVGFDGTPAARSALRFAVSVAAPDSSITVTTVAIERAETGFAAEVDALTGVTADDRTLLAEARDLLGDRAGVSYRSPVGPSVGTVLHRLAAQHEADLVVVGAGHRHGLRRVLSGSDAEDALHGATCAVCVVPERDAGPLHRIAVGFDGSDASRPAVAVAAAVAGQTGAALDVVTVVDTDHPFDAGPDGTDLPHEGRRLLDAEVARLGADTPAHAVLTEGDPTAQLLRAAHDVDLLVLGGRARGPVLRRLLGSVADEVVRLAPCPVLVVPEHAAAGAVPAGAAAGDATPARRGVSW